MEQETILTPTEVTKLQTAHFTDLAPYWYISSILQLPQLTCATWFAVTIHISFLKLQSTNTDSESQQFNSKKKRFWSCYYANLLNNLTKLTKLLTKKSIPSRARLTVWQQEHWTLVAPRMYMSKVWHPPQTNWAISVPVNTSMLEI